MDTQRKRMLSAIALAMLLVVATVVMFGWSEDPALAELQRTFDEAIENGSPPPREAMRERMDQLTEEQRRAFFERNRGRMMELATERMSETLRLPPEERKRAIAEQADRLAKLRASGEPSEGPPGGRPPGGRGRPDADASQSDRMKHVLSRTTPEMRGAFTETKRLLDNELAARGEPPVNPREMRRLMRP